MRFFGKKLDLDLNLENLRFFFVNISITWYQPLVFTNAAGLVKVVKSKNRHLSLHIQGGRFFLKFFM
jgi:hypothetical protein